MHALYTDIVLCVSLSLHFRCRSLHLHGSQINRCYVTNSHCAPFFSCFSCISSFSIFLIFNFLFTFIIHIIRFPFSLCIISVKKKNFSFYFWGVFLSLVSFFSLPLFLFATKDDAADKTDGKIISLHFFSALFPFLTPCSPC